MISACAILTWDLQRSGAITSRDFAVTLFLVWDLKQDLQWSGAVSSRDFAFTLLLLWDLKQTTKITSRDFAFRLFLVWDFELSGKINILLKALVAPPKSRRDPDPAPHTQEKDSVLGV